MSILRKRECVEYRNNNIINNYNINDNVDNHINHDDIININVRVMLIVLVIVIVRVLGPRWLEIILN